MFNRISLLSIALPNVARDRARAEATASSNLMLLEMVQAEGSDVLHRLGVSGEGLNEAEVEARLDEFGPNTVAQEKKKSFLSEIAHRFFTNPINILLTVLAVILYTPIGDDAVGGSLDDDHSVRLAEGVAFTL